MHQRSLQTPEADALHAVSVRSELKPGELTVRMTPVSVLIVVLASVLFSLLVVGVPLAVVARSHRTLVWATVGVVAAVCAANAARSRAVFTPTGVQVRNAYRSYSARWDEVKLVRVVPAPWNCAEFGWAANVIEIDAGRPFVVRASTHLSRSTAGRLGLLLAERANAYGFDAPSSLLPLWKVNAS